ncbi:hypothetical protein [Arthrobacter sp. NA-172]|uniref:hypothetical protein n=1 Tax=Arthrobacter sp. NA-172 TaxID=3367524 RepID=UPI003753EF55
MIAEEVMEQVREALDSYLRLESTPVVFCRQDRRDRGRLRADQVTTEPPSPPLPPHLTRNLAVLQATCPSVYATIFPTTKDATK